MVHAADDRVSVIIPTAGASGTVRGNREVFLDNLLDALTTTCDPARLQVILVVDESQSPTLWSQWEERLPGVLTVAFTAGPFNFSRSINTGVGVAKQDWLLLLNDDIEPIAAGWLDQLLDLARLADVGAVGAQLLYEDGTIQHAGHAYGRGAIFHMGVGQYPPLDASADHGRAREVSGVTAACMLVNRATWNAVGDFDESLPMSFNDVDYCLRLRRHGYRILQSNPTRLFHYESQTRAPGALNWEIREIRHRVGWRTIHRKDAFSPGERPPRGSLAYHYFGEYLASLRKALKRA